MSVEGSAATSIDESIGTPLVELAHDLRTPLTSILFLAETLRSGMSGPLTSLQQHQLGLIYAAAFELSSLANDLTELRLGGKELLEDQPVPFSVGTLMQSVYDIVRPLAESRGVDLRVRRVDSDRRLGHPAALGRVLLNLATNALKSTSRGFVELSATALGENRVLFCVRDTGEGISPELVAQLTNPQASQPQRRAHGYATTGLGLAICRRLVASMGGELIVESAPRSGSRFYFELWMPAVEPRGV